MRSDSSILSGEQAVGQKGGGFLAKFFAQIFSTYSAIQESTEADRCKLTFLFKVSAKQAEISFRCQLH